MARLAGTEADLRVLEVGCGTGTTLAAIRRGCPTARVYGMDLYAEGLRIARTRTNAPLVRGSIQAIPFAAPFDIVCMFDVLEHLPDEAGALRHVRSLIRPGGRLVMTVPAHMWLWSDFDRASGHCRRYEAADLRARLAEQGFHVDFVSEFMSATTPLVWAARKLARRTRRDDPVARDLSVSPLINALLEWSLRPEARWLASGRRLPIGSSLLAVAARPLDRPSA
jgi:SAM-dependent methyltransferase